MGGSWPCCFCAERPSLGGLLSEAGESGPVGGAHRQSAQSCLGETLSALSYSNKPSKSGPAVQLSFTGWGRLTSWFYFSTSLSMPPLLESWVLEQLEMQSPSSPPTWIAPWIMPAAGGGQGCLERSLAAQPWSQKMLVGRRSPLAWGHVAGSASKGSHWAVCLEKLALKGDSHRRGLGFLGKSLAPCAGL